VEKGVISTTGHFHSTCSYLGHCTNLCFWCDNNLEELLMLCFMLWASCFSFLLIKIYVYAWLYLLFINMILKFRLFSEKIETSESIMLRSLHLWRNANNAFFPAVVSLSMATAMLLLCNSKPRYLDDWTRSMVVPLYVNSGVALRRFSNTTTLVLLTLMTNSRST
jgi:hypothetical protein